MPSTYSARLRIQLIANGEQVGSWGATTNTNLGTLIEDAISGMASITMADANYTLSALNGVSDEARQSILKVSGTNTATRTVVVPAATKTYIVWNNTAGGQSILVGTGIGTTTTIINGDKQIVFCDGSNVYQAPATTVPSGGILLWSGSIASIPVGFVLCNGLNGTPDLRDRFIAGAGSGYNPGDTGGNATQTVTVAGHTLVANELPTHVHAITDVQHGHTASDAGHAHGLTQSPHTHTLNDPTHSHTINSGTPLVGYTSGGAFSQSGVSFGTAVGATTDPASTGQSVNGDYAIVSVNTGFSAPSVGAAFSGITSTGNNSTTASAHSHTATGSDNRPPYYALAYIMKT